jgi:hypothetical protein
MRFEQIVERIHGHFLRGSSGSCCRCVFCHIVAKDTGEALTFVVLAAALDVTTVLLTGTLILSLLRAIATLLMLLFATFVLARLVASLILAGLVLSGLLGLLILLILLTAAARLSLLVALILIGHEAPLEKSPLTGEFRAWRVRYVPGPDGCN